MRQAMERVGRIFRHPEYQACLKEICLCEEGRIFCRHTPEHFLDVARLTYLLALEKGLDVNREQIYAAGLLHDIGRHLQYRQGIPHEQASAEIAEGILRDCGFEEGEQEAILFLIRNHRTKTKGIKPDKIETIETGQEQADREQQLAALFCQADKLSRNCFLCPAQEECDWPEEKKNLEIVL